MKSLLFTFLFTFSILALPAQNKIFNKKDDVVKVHRGNTVKIETDSAYVVSTTRARFINQKLDQLDSIQLLYNDLIDNRNELLDQLKSTHKTLTQLLHHMQEDSTAVNQNIVEIINRLDRSLTDLKNNNQELKKNNMALKAEIKNLEDLVKQLKKETKGLWWNHVTDKIVAFAGGVVIGILIAIL